MKNRITRMTAALLAAVLSLGLLVGCKPKKELTRYSTIFYDVFDTVTQVIAYCESEEEFNTQMQALHQDLIAYNQLYDIYNDYDGVVNVKTINENAGKAPVQVDGRILSMLELAQQMYELTGGKINIAMGSVLGIWHDYREAAEQNASEADIQATLDFLYWLVTSEAGTTALADDMGFDIPFKAAKESTNYFKQVAAETVAAGKTPVTWNFTTMPSETWKDGVGKALTDYAQGTGEWDAVVTAFVDGWATEFAAANS